MLDRVPEIRLPLAEIVIDVNGRDLPLRGFAFESGNFPRHRKGRRQQLISPFEIEIVDHTISSSAIDELFFPNSSFSNGIGLLFSRESIRDQTVFL